MNLTPEEAKCRQIRDAKDRLPAGDPIRSNSQLAVQYGHVNLLHSERYGRRANAGMGDDLEEHAHAFRDRLLGGDAIRSDGKLTVESLAVEYGHVNLLHSERYGHRADAGMGDVL